MYIYQPIRGQLANTFSGPNVLGISFTKNVTNNPQSGYTQMVFGDGTQYVGYSAQGVGHTVPVHESLVLDWFGITGTQFAST